MLYFIVIQCVSIDFYLYFASTLPLLILYLASTWDRVVDMGARMGTTE